MLIRNNAISLKVGLTLAFIFLIAISVISLGFFSYKYAKNQFRQELQTKIKSITQAAVNFIDIEDYQKLKTIDDENSIAYQNIKQILKNIKNANEDVRFIYTMNLNSENKKYFVVDAEENEEDKSHLGDEYNEDVPQMNLTFSKGISAVDEDFLQDKWGLWLSGYSAIKNKQGHVLGLVGIDIAATHILEKEQKLLEIIFSISFIVFIFGVILAYYFAIQINDTLFKLNQEVSRIQNLDLSESIPLNSFIYEIKQVINAVESMKKGLRSFKKYVPSELVTDIIRDRKEAHLSAEKRNITVMFTDITNFTGITEKLTSEQLSKQYSQYLEACSNVIREHQGTIDKYIGDAIMAIWGAPQVNANHMIDACLTALQMQIEVEKLNSLLVQNQLPPFETRIGLSSGECIVGNIGHHQRLSYTAMGDTVNLANRIENLNKDYKTKILVSEEIAKATMQLFNFKFIDEVNVRGKTNKINIYELVSIKDKTLQFDNNLVKVG